MFFRRRSEKGGSMKKEIFKGSGVAIVTPFNDKGIDYDAFTKLVEFNIENKTDAIIVCGTTGEASTMDDKEHREIVEYCVKVVAGRVPVIAGAGSNDTAYAVSLSKHAQDVGVDAILSVSPYYNKTTQRGLIEHFKAIAQSIDIPVILYNIASRTGLNINPETFYELSKIENIVAVKEASGSISQVADIRAHCGDNLHIYSGDDDQTVAMLALGGKGVISVLANIMPKAVHEMCALFFEGKVEESANMQISLLDLIRALFIETNPIPVKTALNLMAMNAGLLRLPLCEMSEGNLNILKKAMKNHKLI